MSLAVGSCKKLSTVVLDLDNTLIFTAFDGEVLPSTLPAALTNCPAEVASAIINDQRPYDYSFFVNDPHFHNYFGYFRPGMLDFLRLLPDYFEQIIVWSAGTTDYVDYICYFIFSQVGYVPNVILARDDCVKLPNGKFSKPLLRIFADYNADPNRTYLIDDSKFSMQPNRDCNCKLVTVPYNGEVHDRYLRESLIPWLVNSVGTL